MDFYKYSLTKLFDIPQIITIHYFEYGADFSFDGETFTFTTTGYGHGVGLSQYGADYLARQGKTYQEILEHYYSGTTLVERA